MTLYPASPEGLNNIPIGGPDNHRVGVAFRARFSSPLAAIRWYSINSNPPNHPGYAGGNGGRYKYEIFNDANGVPGTLVASSYHVSGGPPGTTPVTTPQAITAATAGAVPRRIKIVDDNNGLPGATVQVSGWLMDYPLAAPVPASPIASGGVLVDDKQYPEFVNLGGFPLIGFPSFPMLTGGLWYHFVITNVDPSPTINYISFDALLGKNDINPDPDSFIEYSDATGKNWTKYQSMMASPFGIFYANGNRQGNSGYQLASNGSTMPGTSYGFFD